MRPILLVVSSASDVWPFRAALLASCGYAISPATSTERALSLLDRGLACAVVVGHSLSREEKMSLIHRSRSLQVPVPVICMHRSDDGVCGADVEISAADGPQALISAVTRFAGTRHDVPQA